MSDLITKLHTMCNMFEMGHTIRSTTLVRQAANLIEQLQQRNAELEEKLKNLGESTLASLVKQFDEAPEDAEFDGSHPILQLAIKHAGVIHRNDELASTVQKQTQRIDQLLFQVSAEISENKNLRRERQQLIATVERLRQALHVACEHNRKGLGVTSLLLHMRDVILSKTPTASLNHVKRDCLLILARDLSSTSEIEYNIIECIEAYANNKYPTGE